MPGAAATADLGIDVEALLQRLADLEEQVRTLRLESEAKDRTILRLSRENEELRTQLYGRKSEKEDKNERHCMS